MRATHLVSYRQDDLPDTFPSGRRCSTRGCRTILSTYNPTRKCAGCGGWHKPIKDDALKGDDLMELLETP
jgi:hypothetical protein